jgi:hypothetical protein
MYVACISFCFEIEEDEDELELFVTQVNLSDAEYSHGQLLKVVALEKCIMWAS